MAIPTPESLIASVKPELVDSDTFIASLSAVMSDEQTVKDSYRGGGLFTFYLEGYMNSMGKIETRKALEEAGYEVHRIDQQVGYIPPAWWHDNKSAGHEDPGVTGTSQSPWFIVSISKKKETA